MGSFCEQRNSWLHVFCEHVTKQVNLKIHVTTVNANLFMYFLSAGGPLRLEKKKAKALDIHLHFCGFSQHSLLSFIHSIFFPFHWRCNFPIPVSLFMEFSCRQW